MVVGWNLDVNVCVGTRSRAFHVSPLTTYLVLPIIIVGRQAHVLFEGVAAL